MGNELITSRKNPLVKELQGIRDDRDCPLLFLEGPRLVEEVLSLNQLVEILVWTTAAEADPVVSAAQKIAKRLCRVSQTVFEALSDVKSPQGVLAIVKRPTWTWEDLTRKTPLPIVVLDGVQDPGNMASILRTAEASSASGIVATLGTARLFSPKALRGAMGSTLRVPILEHQMVDDISRELKKAGYQLIGTASQTSSPAVSGVPFLSRYRQGQSPVGDGGPSHPYSQFDWTRPSAIILGHEGQGLSKEWSRHMTSAVHIPMQPPVESLNVAAAAAVLLYESYRQRKQA